MANISLHFLTDDAILYLVQYLDLKDRLALACTSDRFRELCISAKAALRKVDLSECELVSRETLAITKQLFINKQTAKHIRELNLNNQRIDGDIEEFLISSFPQLESLHALNCGLSFRILHHILQHAPKLTALSWSCMELTSEDIQLLTKTMGRSDGICFKNIKYLQLETVKSDAHDQILNYLVLPCCNDLKELKIYAPSREIGNIHGDISLPQPFVSAENILQHVRLLHIIFCNNLKCYNNVRYNRATNDDYDYDDDDDDDFSCSFQLENSVGKFLLKPTN